LTTRPEDEGILWDRKNQKEKRRPPPLVLAAYRNRVPKARLTDFEDYKQAPIISVESFTCKKMERLTEPIETTMPDGMFREEESTLSLDLTLAELPVIPAKPPEYYLLTPSKVAASNVRGKNSQPAMPSERGTRTESPKIIKQSTGT
jgi:hypothetical protein